MRLLVGAFMLVGAIATAGPSIAGAAEPGEVCATSEFSWQGDRKLVPWDAVGTTGVVIPAPAAGETLRVLTATYATYDVYPEGSSPTRAEAAQEHESVGLMIGGVAIGGLSTDVPNGIAEGAPSDFYSGIVTGSFGGGGTVINGGELVVRHASLYGFNETPNSVFASQLTVTVERCTQAPTTTVAVTPTTTPAPTTTAVVTPPTTPPTTPAPTTTAVGSGGPTTTVAGGSVTTVPGGTLPATGGDMTLPLILAGLAAGTGAALLMVRRKAGTH